MLNQEKYLLAVIAGQMICLSLLLLLFWRQRRKKSREELELLLRAEEQAMKKIAADLHDNLAPSLLLTRIQLEQLEEKKEIKDIKACVDRINSVLMQTRMMSLLLQPRSLTQTSLVESTKELLQTLDQHTPIKTHLDVDPPSLHLPEEQEVPLFRIIQEATQNILKHAQATDLSICFKEQKSFIEVDIKDNGVGYDRKAVRPGAGLENMEQRILQLKGQLTVQSQPGMGTRIHLQIPK